MRASYQKDLIIQDEYVLRGDVAHHLLNVVRVSDGEGILLLNGNGLVINTKIISHSKKELTLIKINHSEIRRTFVMDLALGIPKKEALELSLKQSVELGFRKIFLIRSKYSQIRIPENERIESILVSALEQSNSAYLPEVIMTDWEGLPSSDYGQIVMMDSQSPSQKTKGASELKARLLIVGPEAGFSSEELALLHSFPVVSVLNLPTPILRTPTAVAAGAGIMLKSLLD